MKNLQDVFQCFVCLLACFECDGMGVWMCLHIFWRAVLGGIELVCSRSVGCIGFRAYGHESSWGTIWMNLSMTKMMPMDGMRRALCDKIKIVMVLVLMGNLKTFCCGKCPPK